ncbi:MAG: hypothetical protein HYV68_00945 [Candidatus Taylorbacteria bacterium]|nr:hypothetical protein [Candidatus Taylorbacteria bacterium]
MTNQPWGWRQHAPYIVAVVGLVLAVKFVIIPGAQYVNAKLDAWFRRPIVVQAVPDVRSSGGSAYTEWMVAAQNTLQSEAPNPPKVQLAPEEPVPGKAVGLPSVSAGNIKPVQLYPEWNFQKREERALRSIPQHMLTPKHRARLEYLATNPPPSGVAQ